MHDNFVPFREQTGSSPKYFKGLKSDRWIREMSEGEKEPLIYPFVGESTSELMVDGEIKKVPSYGLSSYGYDLRLGNKFRLFSRSIETHNSRPYFRYGLKGGQNSSFVRDVDEDVISDFAEPFDIESLCGPEIEADWIELPPYSFMLAYAQEFLQMPRNVTGICMGKSTVARRGQLVVVTPAEPGWKGHLTLEIFNMTGVPVRYHAGMGITQLQFFESEECDVSYADRNGKYQNQTNQPITPR
jgi:dCTP deaminase